MASAEEVKNTTGFTIGGVSPIGHLKTIDILIDSSFERFKDLFAAAGHPNAVFETKDKMMNQVTDIAIKIAQKSPLTIRGIKHVMNYSRDHSVADGLQYVATWNASMLLSEDIQIAMKALMSKTPPIFKD